MSEPELRELLIEAIEDSREDLKNCKDQNSCYFGMLMGAHDAYKQVLDWLDE